MDELTLDTGQKVHIELYRHKNPIVNDAYDRLVAGIHLYKKNKDYRTFTVTGCQPGAGATTIAISLAVSMAISGWKTLLVDTDMKKGVNHKRLSKETQYGLSHHLRGGAPLEQIIYKTNYQNLDYVACGDVQENAVELLCSSGFDAFLTRVKAQYDVVIFDSPSLNAAVDAGILAARTDAVILVAQQGKTRTTQIQAARRELQNVGANLLGIVMNHVGKQEYKRFLKNYDYFKNYGKRANKG